MAKKKNNSNFVPEESIESKREKYKQSSIIEGVVLFIISFYVGMMGSAYLTKYPRNDVFDFLSEFGTIIQDPLFFLKVKNVSFLGPLSLSLLIVLFVYLQYAYGKLRVHTNDDNVKGSTKWVEGLAKTILKEKYGEFILEKGFLPWQKKKNYQAAYNNTIMGKDFYVSLNTKKHYKALNTLLLGATGTGKTRFWLKPNLLQMNCSYAITDPKGEILDSCGEILRRNGYDVKVFDLVEQGNCNSYNPLKYCKKESDIKKIVQAFMKNTDSSGGNSGSKDPFWDDSMSAFLCACIGFLVSKPEDSDIPYGKIDDITGGTNYEACFPTLCELTRMANRKWTEASGIRPMEGVQLGDGKNNTANASELALLFENLRAYEAKIQDCEIDEIVKPYCLREWENFRIAPEKTSTTILMTTAVRLDPFNIEQIKNLTCTDTMDLDLFATKRTALFLIMPATDRTYNFLLSFLYTQLFDILYQFGEKKVKGSKSLKLPSGELVKWFSKEDIDNGIVDEKIKAIKNSTIEEETINGIQRNEEHNITFDDTVFNIIDADGELISRRPTKDLAKKYIKELQKVKLENGSVPALPTHVRFLIDEFPNIGEIPDFKEKLATMRGYEISATVICQTITQLKGLYEKDYEVVDNNCPFVVFLGGDENTNNEYLTKKLGDSTAVTHNTSVDKQKVNGSYNKDSKKLMNQEDLGRIPYENELVFVYGEQPIYEKKCDVKEHKNFKLSREYFADLNMDVMEFNRDNYKIEENVPYIYKGSRILAIPNVISADKATFLNAMRSFLKVPTVDGVIEKANANIERFSFEEKSVAVAY